MQHPERNTKRISEILSRSKKFISLFQIGGVSFTYNSYSEDIQESLDRTLDSLIACISDKEAHLGISSLLSSYQPKKEYSYMRVLEAYIEEKRSIHLVSAAEQIVKTKRVEESFLRRITEAAVEVIREKEYALGEASLQLINSIYLHTSIDRRYIVTFIHSMFSPVYIDLYLCKIYPCIMQKEEISLVLGILQGFLGIEQFPLLSLFRHVNSCVMAMLPDGIISRVKELLRAPRTKQECLDGLSIINQRKDIIPYSDITLLLLFLDGSGLSILYEQSVLFIEYLESTKKETFPEQIDEFLKRLYEHSDGTKIQLSRILYIIPECSYKDTLLSLLRHKNIRVQWNALRALTRFHLDRANLEEITRLYAKTKNNKIHLWCLKAAEGKESLLAEPMEQPSIKETKYQEEIEERIKKIKETFLFYGRSTKEKSQQTAFKGQ
ncbi:hypothetical protein NEFER02_0226 [Nematocida sp. LUAm2]|nr:hypothetical protein NEFER02_0226 [Nematocida sp. LUAm2]